MGSKKMSVIASGSAKGIETLGETFHFPEYQFPLQNDGFCLDEL